MTDPRFRGLPDWVRRELEDNGKWRFTRGNIIAVALYGLALFALAQLVPSCPGVF